LPAAKFATRGSERRKGALALVVDRLDPT